MSDNINAMNFKQLRNEVQLLRDELAIMKRKYEDVIYNLDTDNFSSRFVKEQGNMRTAIEVTAKGIETKVSNEEFQSAISLTADKIETEVKNLSDADVTLSSRITQTEELIKSEVSALSSKDAYLYSQISQTSSEIRSVVSKNISAKFISNVHPNYIDTSATERGMLCEFDGVLYYYNDIKGYWEEYPYADGIKSQFLQTASGFELTGDVSISGDAIVGGVITGAALGNPYGTTRIVLGDDTGSTYGDMLVKRINPDGTETTIFSVIDLWQSIYLCSMGTAMLQTTGYDTYLYNNWDFSSCDINWGNNAPVAKFG